jgi:hypothetical protein
MILGKELLDKKTNSLEPIVKKWYQDVCHIKDKHIQRCAAMLLQNQENAYAYGLIQNSTKKNFDFTDYIINIFPKLIIHKLISVDVSCSPANKYLSHKFNRVTNSIEIIEDDIFVKSNTIIADVQNYGQKIKKHIEKEVLFNLWEHSGITKFLDKNTTSNDLLLQTICLIMGLIQMKCLTAKEFWVVVNKECYQKFDETFDLLNNKGWFKDRVFIADLPDGILIGVANSEFYMKDFVFCDYTYGIIDSIGANMMINHRYAKKLPIKDQYAKIVFT